MSQQEVILVKRNAGKLLEMYIFEGINIECMIGSETG